MARSINSDHDSTTDEAGCVVFFLGSVVFIWSTSRPPRAYRQALWICRDPPRVWPQNQKRKHNGGLRGNLLAFAHLFPRFHVAVVKTHKKHGL